ncbi:uncharacterized protein Bfra_000328 [Botrytis fragariae]|uniref:Uncharacterized protein n=1 Tax=Botrytis fragariae TaxID=1964551 RepID=A0A8H6EMV7_9HELO|nr:uncharacterized protein Bfra_000328 [Botrytis fragariae]KAF5878161.1 hypothetical protein Bfra_000328 [Botrytis fragariae]
MGSEKILQVFEIWVAYGETGVIQEGVLIVPYPSSSSSIPVPACTSESPLSSSNQFPIPYLFHTTHNPSSSVPSASAPGPSLPSSVGGRSSWQGNILASSLPLYLQICASITSRHCSAEEVELLRKPAEWTKMLFLDLAREGIWVESILTESRDRDLGRERERRRESQQERDSRRRRRRSETERAGVCDSMMLGRLRRRLGYEVRAYERGGRQKCSGGRVNRNPVSGCRPRRRRQVLRPRRARDDREGNKILNPKVCASL